MAKTERDFRQQAIGEATRLINQQRVDDLAQELTAINQEYQIFNANQNEALKKAIDEIVKVREFIGNQEHILGSSKTKHGEIAEVVEVHIRNAKQLIEQLKPNSTFGDLSRIDKEIDFFINDKGYQSKFIGGIGNTIEKLENHLKNNPNFSGENAFIIPKDRFEELKNVLENSETYGHRGITIERYIERIKQLEKETGKSFDELVEPSISNYQDVQQKNIGETLDRHQTDIEDRNSDIKTEQKQNKEEEKELVQTNHQPSINEALKTGAISAAISGGMTLAIGVYKKRKSGKKIYEFTNEDWKELGIDFSKSAGEGGVSGMAIYGLTNYTKMPAPIASAYVSSAFGVAYLAKSCKEGKLSYDEFVEESSIICLDAGLVGLAATIGQAVIPIPIVGTLVGTFAMKATLSFTRDYLGEKSKEFEKKLNNDYSEHLKTVNEELKIEIEKIVNDYDKLGQISNMAFDFDKNAFFRFKASVELAEKSGVEESKIIRSDNDLDKFILS